MTYYFEFNHKEALEKIEEPYSTKLKFAIQAVGNILNDAHTWQIEFEPENKFRIKREIAFDILGNKIYSSPSFQGDHGFWIDVNPNLSFLTNLEPNYLKVLDFNNAWEKTT